MTEQQAKKIKVLCERRDYPLNTEEVKSKFMPAFDLPTGWLAGWVGNVYYGIDPDGNAHS